MKKQSDVEFELLKPFRPVNHNPDFSLFNITELRETNEGYRHWFDFKINEIGYTMMLVGDLYDEQICDIIGVHHSEKICPFCAKEETKTNYCIVLSDHIEKLFHLLLSHSKNRLRWMMKNVR